MKVSNFFGICSLLFAFWSCNDKPVNKDSGTKLAVEKPADSLTFNAKNFPIYTVHKISINDSIAKQFISLSDRYKGNDIMPAYLINNQKKVPFEKLKRVNLPSSYRQKMLANTGIKENDSLYLFNYESGDLQKIPVNQLNAVAYLDFYTTEGDDISESNYMLGLEPAVDLKIKEEKNKNYNLLAYIGEINPFAEKPLVPVSWTKISTTKLPVGTSTRDSLTLDVTYEFDHGNFVYYAEDYSLKGTTVERQLVVKDKVGKLVHQRTYDLKVEGASAVPLDGGDQLPRKTYQWTGVLFKNQPPVIFGMVSYSFGCPEITFLDASREPFFILCDNRLKAFSSK